MMSYEYNSIYFDYTKLNKTDYLIEYNSPYVVRTQYLSSEGCWIEELNDAPNTDTSSVINKISNIRRRCNILPDIDSVSYNRLQIYPTLNDGILPDSVAYLCYFYKSGKSGVKVGLLFHEIQKTVRGNKSGNGNTTTSRASATASFGFINKMVNLFSI